MSDIDTSYGYSRIFLFKEDREKYKIPFESKIVNSGSLVMYGNAIRKELKRYAHSYKSNKLVLKSQSSYLYCTKIATEIINSSNIIINLKEFDNFKVHTIAIASEPDDEKQMRAKFKKFTQFYKDVYAEKYLLTQNITNQRKLAQDTIDYIAIINDCIYPVFLTTKQFIVEEPLEKILQHEKEVDLLEKEDQINNRVSLSCNTTTIAFSLFKNKIIGDGYAKKSNDFQLGNILTTLNNCSNNLCEVCHQSYQSHAIKYYHKNAMLKIKISHDIKPDTFPDGQINTCQYEYEKNNNVSYEDIVDNQYLSYSWGHYLMQYFYNGGNMTKQNSYKYTVNDPTLKISRRFKLKKVNIDFIYSDNLQLYTVPIRELYSPIMNPISSEMISGESEALTQLLSKIDNLLEKWKTKLLSGDIYNIFKDSFKLAENIDKEKDKYRIIKFKSINDIFRTRKNALLSYLKIYYCLTAMMVCHTIYEHKITAEAQDEITIFKKVYNAVRFGSKKETEHSIFKANKEDCPELNETAHLIYNELHANIILQENGVEDQVIPINSQDKCSIICYVLSSKEYWNSLYILNYLGLNERNKQIKARNEIDLSKLNFLKMKRSKKNLAEIECKDSSILRMKILLKREKGNEILIESAKDELKIKKSKKEATYYDKEGLDVKICASDEIAKEIDEVYAKAMIVPGIPPIQYKVLSSEHKNLMRKELNQGEDEIFISIYYAKQFEALRSYEFNTPINFLCSVLRSDIWKDNSGGKTKANFFKTYDQRFVIKCIDKKELNMFKAISFSYFHHIARSFSGVPTALAKVYGAYRIVTKESNNQTQKIYAIVMENIFYNINFTVAYDLKGSETRRYCKEKDKKVKLDTNFKKDFKGKPLLLDYKSDKRIKTALVNDTRFLSESMVMDYSLLLVIDEVSNKIHYGIIDYVRKYTFDKRMETAGKSFFNETRPTVINPNEYRIRFLEYLDRYILGVPELTDWTPNESRNRKYTDDSISREDSRDSKGSTQTAKQVGDKMDKGFPISKAISEMKEEFKSNDSYI